METRLAALSRNRPLMVGLFVEVPVIFLAGVTWLIAAKRAWIMLDFQTARAAAHAVVHGVSPYPPLDPSVVRDATHLVYPPLVGYLFLPFDALPYSLAAPLYLFVLAASLLAALALLGVRDWRCYGIVFLWFPTLACFVEGTLGPLLVLLLAITWRYRDRVAIVVTAVALLIAAKLFLWPLAVWLVATRRFRAAGLAAVVTVAAVVVPFTPLGLNTLRRYPKVLQMLDRVWGGTSLSSNSFFHAAGASTNLGRTLVVVVGAVLVVGVLYVGLRLRDERSALATALVAALLTSPIVWVHYYVLLLVPIALARPSLSGLWFAPLLYWGSIAEGGRGDLRRLAWGVGVTCAITSIAVFRRDQKDGEEAGGATVVSVRSGDGAQLARAATRAGA